ncbi:MAG: DUF3325 family protein [Pseudomonadota bacterium]
MLFVTFLVVLLGLALISSSMNRHVGVLGLSASNPERLKLFKYVGYVALALAIPLAIKAAGVGLGLTWWFALVTVAHFSLALLLTYLKK